MIKPVEEKDLDRIFDMIRTFLGLFQNEIRGEIVRSYKKVQIT